MPLNFTTTATAREDQGIKLLIYGPPGSGKTRLCATAPEPLILSAEAGLLSLSPENQIRMFGGARDIPVLKIESAKDLEDAYAFVATSAHAKHFETICLDSISEIAEVVLGHMKKQVKDPRQAYGEMGEKMAFLIRAFRDLPNKHVYFSAKQERVADENNKMFYGPSMPGKMMTQGIGHFFDEVFAAGVTEDIVSKQRTYFLRTRMNIQFQAKDRSGALDEIEQPDLTNIISKIQLR